MAFRAGTTTALYVSNAAGALQNLSPYADTSNVNQSSEQLNVSAFGTAAKAFLNGQTDGTFSIGGPLDATLHTTIGGLFSAGSAASWIYGPGGSVAGQVRMAGSVNVASYNISSDASGRVTYAASLQITGAVSSGSF